MAFNRDGTDKNGKIGLGDLARVRPSDAIDLMVHHLMIAEVYFQAVPDNRMTFDVFRDALLEQCSNLGVEDPLFSASTAFYRQLDDKYQKMKDDDVL